MVYFRSRKSKLSMIVLCIRSRISRIRKLLFDIVVRSRRNKITLVVVVVVVK